LTSATTPNTINNTGQYLAMLGSNPKAEPKANNRIALININTSPLLITSLNLPSMIPLRITPTPTKPGISPQMYDQMYDQDSQSPVKF